MQQLQKNDQNWKRIHPASKEKDRLGKKTNKKVCGKLLWKNLELVKFAKGDPTNLEKPWKLQELGDKVRFYDCWGVGIKKKINPRTS